jgi:hypothetical protein
LIGLSLLGIALSLRDPNRSALGLLAFALAAGVLLLPPVFWRVRAGLLPLALPFAGFALDWLVTRGPRLQRWAAAVLVLAFTAWAFLFPPKPLYRLRAAETLSAAKVRLLDGDRVGALRELDEFLALARQGKTERARIGLVQQARSRLMQPGNPSANDLP